MPSIRIREQGRLLRQIKTGVTCFRQQQSHVPLSSKTVICCVQQPRLHSPDPPSVSSLTTLCLARPCSHLPVAALLFHVRIPLIVFHQNCMTTIAFCTLNSQAFVLQGKSSLEQSSNSDTTNGNGVSDQRSQPSVDIAEKRELQDGPAPQTASSWSLSDHMVNLAQVILRCLLCMM